MSSAELELASECVSGDSVVDLQESEAAGHGPFPSQNSIEGDSLASSDPLSANVQTQPELRSFRLTATGEKTVHVYTWLQAKGVDSNTPSRLLLETPEDVSGVKIRMSVDARTLRFKLDYSVEMPGLPIDEALHYAEFIRTLYSEGTLSIVTLEPVEVTIADVPLPVATSEADKENLEWHLQLYERLRCIGEATGLEMLCPNEVEGEDLRNLERVEDIISAGWVIDRVSGFTLWLEEEGTLDLLKHNQTSFEGLAMTTGNEQISLFGDNIDLGPTMRWIAQVQLDTPLEEIEEWLRLRPQDGQAIETHWTSLERSPLHAIFYDWPKPSVESVKQDIKAFEQKYGMSWKKFKRDWEQNKPRVQYIDDGDVWMSLIEARDHMQQQS